MPISKALRVGKFIITSEDIAPGAVTFADIGTIYSSNITENSNLFFSNARATAAVEASLLANLNIAGNLVVDSNVLYIDSVNNRVGVGTTTPTRLFTVQNDNPSGSATLGVRNQSSGTGAFVQITAETLGTTGYFYTFGSGYTSSGSYLANSSLIETNGTNGLGLSAVSANTNASIRFYTNQTERLRLDTAGNLGLGVTPSAYWGSNKALEIGSPGCGFTSRQNYELNIMANAAYGTYAVTGKPATMYTLSNSGQHIWFTAPSGTAGNAISFTQAMTLDSSGNLGIGSTSPADKLHVVGSLYVSNKIYNGVNADSAGITFPSSALRLDGYNGITFHSSSTNVGSQTERLRIENTGHILPGADATQNFGSTSRRWANIYTADLNLSNEGQSNSVDGTWGAWTIQEGINDLFVLNRRSGKVFKIKLEEV